MKNQNFIPFQSRDIIRMCLHDDSLEKIDRDQFSLFASMLRKHFHTEFHQMQISITEAYKNSDPDSDTLAVDINDFAAVNPEDFKDLLKGILQKANFCTLSRSQVELAMEESSLFKIRLDVDFDAFDEMMFFYRGATEKVETLSYFGGLFMKKVSFINYERVAIYLKTEAGTSLKLFRNIPKSDIEMLFPNTKICMRLRDKLLVGVPAVISGGVVLTTKLGATVVLLSSLLGFWLGLSSKPVHLDSAALLVLCAGMGAFAGYIWKQFSNFKNRKLRFAQALTQNLYFKLLDNNAGVLYRLMAEAEDEEFKESLIAYYFLLQHPNGIDQQALDHKIELWFEQKWGCSLDFEVDDALQKLERLKLVVKSSAIWTPSPISEAGTLLLRATPLHY